MAGSGIAGMPLRPLGVAEVLDAAARLVRRNLRASFAIALPVEAARTVLVALLVYSSVDGLTAIDGSSAFPGSGPNLPLPLLLLEILITWTTLPLLTGLLAPLFVEDALGQRQTTAQTLRRVGRSWLPLLGLAVIVGVTLDVGLVLLVVGGVWLWGVWALAAPALVTERLGPIRALRRSFDLVRGRFWRVWGVRALGAVVVSVLAALLTVPAGLLALWLGTSDPFGDAAIVDRPALYVTITALGSLIANVLLSPFRAAVDTVLYLDSRMRSEGLDLVMALDADDADSDAATARPAPATPAW